MAAIPFEQGFVALLLRLCEMPTCSKMQNEVRAVHTDGKKSTICLTYHCLLELLRYLGNRIEVIPELWDFFSFLALCIYSFTYVEWTSGFVIVKNFVIMSHLQQEA